MMGGKKELTIKPIQEEYKNSNVVPVDDLREFKDDVVILGKVDDCEIGRFKTDDGDEKVIESIKNCKENAKDKLPLNKNSELLHGYTELPAECLRGWVKF
jgi:hypothetical protein